MSQPHFYAREHSPNLSPGEDTPFIKTKPLWAANMNNLYFFVFISRCFVMNRRVGSTTPPSFPLACYQLSATPISWSDLAKPHLFSHRCCRFSLQGWFCSNASRCWPYWPKNMYNTCHLRKYDRHCQISLCDEMRGTYGAIKVQTCSIIGVYVHRNMH